MSTEITSTFEPKLSEMETKPETKNWFSIVSIKVLSLFSLFHPQFIQAKTLLLDKGKE